MSRWARWFERVGRFFRRADKPPPAPTPRRLQQAVQLFQLQRPSATPAEWATFALRLAAEAHDQGLARGFDRGRGVPELEEERRHGWAPGDGRPELVKALAGRDPRDPLAGVPQDERVEFVEQVARAQRAGVQLHLELRPPGPTQHDRRP